VSFKSRECVQHEIDPSTMMASVLSLAERWGPYSKALRSSDVPINGRMMVLDPRLQTPLKTCVRTKQSKTRQEQHVLFNIVLQEKPRVS